MTSTPNCFTVLFVIGSVTSLISTLTESIWENELKNAYSYFLKNFWLDNGCPKYYNNSLFPIDIHCSAQGIVTCIKMSAHNPESNSFAIKIANWAIENMQDRGGYFYYQKYNWIKIKTPYIRWSQAWMFYALALLSKSTAEPFLDNENQ